MAKAYLIGGAPRIGKSNLTMKLVRQRPAYAISTGPLTEVLRGVIDKNTMPDLFHSSVGDSPAEAVEWQVKENRIVWQSALELIDRTIGNRADIIVEGLCVVPELMKQLDCDYTAVFLGNQSDEHFETIKKFAKDNPHDWLNNYDDSVIHDICLFNQAYSKFIENEAGKYGLPYVEISDTAYEASMNEALGLLVT